MDPSIRMERVDYRDARHGAHLVDLLDHYARDPAGGGEPLSDFARAKLASSLAALPSAYSLIAYDRDVPVGLINCIEGFSTFACRPLVNVHDVAVLPAWRGRGIGALLLEQAEAIARERGACKLTLEVLQGNHGAIRVYQRLGFAGYQLDPAMGVATFMQKWLD